MNDSVEYLSYAGGDDAFIPLFIIIGVLLTVAANLTMLVALVKIQDLEFYHFVKMMCYLDLAAAVTVFPMALIASANHHVLELPTFCNVYGILLAFLNRASMINVCAINVERYYFVARPMKYNHSMSRATSRAINAGVLGLALVLSVSPVGISFLTDVKAYRPFSHAPICVSLPSTVALSAFSFFDVTISFFIPWCIIFSVSGGMLKIACRIINPSVKPIILPTPRRSEVVEDINISRTESLPTLHLPNLPMTSNTRGRQRQRMNKDRMRRRRSSSTNLKALITITTTLCVFTVLNVPLGSVMIIMNINGVEEQSSNVPTLEYIACIAMLTTYAVYPPLNGLTNREIRSKMLQMLRNAMKLDTMYLEELDSEFEHKPLNTMIKERETKINIEILNIETTMKETDKARGKNGLVQCYSSKVSSNISTKEIRKVFLSREMKPRFALFNEARTSSAPSSRISPDLSKQETFPNKLIDHPRIQLRVRDLIMSNPITRKPLACSSETDFHNKRCKTQQNRRRSKSENIYLERRLFHSKNKNVIISEHDIITDDIWEEA